MKGSEEMKLWLFDLAHGNLSDEQIVQGFTRYYTLLGLTIGNVQDDMVFHTHYDPEQIRAAMKRLRDVLKILAGE